MPSVYSPSGMQKWFYEFLKKKCEQSLFAFIWYSHLLKKRRKLGNRKKCEFHLSCYCVTYIFSGYVSSNFFFIIFEYEKNFLFVYHFNIFYVFFVSFFSFISCLHLLDRWVVMQLVNQLCIRI